MSKRLGKGLEALLGAREREDLLEVDNANGLTELNIQQLEPGRYQPRTSIQEADLLALSDSIRSQGIIQPILVREKNKDKYEIIAGERRWRAAKLAGLDKVPVVIKNVSDEKTLAIALIENIQREDLSPLEEAKALERLTKEFDLTHQQVAEAVGKSRTTITNLLRLLTLPEEVKQLLEEGRLEVGHAKVLLGLKSGEQIRMAEMIAAKGLSVRETETFIDRAGKSPTSPISSTRVHPAGTKDPDVQRLEMALSEKLGAKVEIIFGEKSKGRIVIHYNNLEELEGILAHIQ